MVSQLGTLLIVFGFWKYGLASDCIEIYIKPNATATVVCPYKGNQKSPIIWKKSSELIGFGNEVRDKKEKFMISNNNGAGKSMLEIVNFSVRDEDMYRCISNHGKDAFEIYFNIHMCDIPLEMNLFSETDNNTLDEHLKNVLCSVDDTDVATTQVHSSTHEESTNIRGIIQNVTCSVLNMDQCFTANITLQLNLTWREKEDPNNTVSGSEKEQPTKVNNSFHNIAYGNCSYPVSCDCGSFFSTHTAKHMYKGFFKKWNLFLKNFESSDYCDCILYIHKCQGKVTSGSHDNIVYLVSVLSASIAILGILAVIGVYLILIKRNTVRQINNNDDGNNTTDSPAISQPNYATLQPGSVLDVAPLQSTNVKPRLMQRTNHSARVQHQESSRHKSLEYVDIVFDSTKQSRKFCIRGERGNTPYADIDLTLKADPLPDSESSDSSDDEKIK